MKRYNPLGEVDYTFFVVSEIIKYYLVDSSYKVVDVQLQRLAPRVISRTSTEIRISFEFRLMLVGADRGAYAFVLCNTIRLFPYDGQACWTLLLR
ncbi:hypothetical protein DFR59_108112 [Falsibacillus pallidus]|uniref:Uncharacterized protein n=1 Tax=Falsibacillus pallidus TaxID=493781 RepID=A0A370GCN0_9BACI|nr:hypothetical protein DFR59_108112 [Falsibacillus pallidus]